MTDSTPSQSNVSSEAFEALIDLLATDGIDEQPITPPGARTRAQPNATLRDDSGRLDFDKIRLMFAGQPDNPLVLDVAESLANGTRRSMRRSEEGESDDEPLRSHRSTSNVPSPPISPPPPPPVNQGTSNGHRRSSTFGNQPWAGMADSGKGANDLLPGSGSIPEQPLSFDELNNALTNAHAEVKSLRQQYDELDALVSKRFGNQAKEKHQTGSPGVNVAIKQVENGPPTEKKEGEPIDPQLGTGGPRVQPDESRSPSSLSSDVPLEIASLTESEAKKALTTLVTMLNLSPAAMLPLATVPLSTSSSPPQIQGQHDVNSLTRAVKFVSAVDELVWRRSVTSSGPRALQPIFSEDNIAGLLSRLELWERAVRRSSKI